jgi:hypothetical protein
LFLGTVSGGALVSISLTNGELYRAIDSSYTYDPASGWYENIPVAGHNLTGATADIQFGVVTEVISNRPNVYQSDSTHPMPCDKDTTATSMFSHDHGTGLMVYCSSHNPLVSFGHDNLTAIESVNDYETAQIAAHTPICVKFSGRFLSSAIDLAATPPHLITGGPCLEGDAQRPHRRTAAVELDCGKRPVSYAALAIVSTAQFQGNSSAMRLMGWSAMCAMMSRR